MNDAKVKIVELDLNDILPNRFQPRIKFNEDSIVELSESIKMHGLLQPIIVRPISDKYEIVVGERRYKAAVMAELSTIPARVVDLDDKASIELALIENLQRRDLNPMEEAISYKKTLSMGYMTQEQLAKKLGKSQSSIANKIRLLNLSDEVQEALMDEKISERHARSLLKVDSEKNQVKLLNRIIEERLTVRKLDEIISKKEFDSVVSYSNETLNNKNIEKSSHIKEDTENEKKKIDPENDFDEIDEYINSNSEKIVDISEILSFIDDEDLEENDDEKILEDDKDEEEENMGNIHNLLDSDFDDNQNTVKSGSRFFNPELLNKSESESEQSTINNDFVEKNSVRETPSTPNIFTQSYNINNLMTPQSQISSSTNNIFSLDSKNTNSEIPGQPISKNETFLQTQSSQSQPSMFSNLLNGNTSGEQIDKNTLNAFLDPTFIDGEKQNGSDSSSSIDEQVFAKFIDPDFGGEIESSSGDVDVIANSSQNSVNNLLDTNTSLTSSVGKPDLLAPMTSNHVVPEKQDNEFTQILNQIHPKDEKSTQPSTINDIVIPVYSNQSELTLDDSVNKNEEENEKEVSITRPSESTSIPAFVTSSSFNQSSAPLTPIIDKTSMDDLLKPMTLNSNDNRDENGFNVTSNYNNEFESLDSQPIIITDYNKQYDPILPESLTEKKPTIDFKNILNMIRDLNNKIESYGYEIDTEEIDLQDVYQVIFNITKK